MTAVDGESESPLIPSAGQSQVQRTVKIYGDSGRLGVRKEIRVSVWASAERAGSHGSPNGAAHAHVHPDQAVFGRTRVKRWMDGWWWWQDQEVLVDRSMYSRTR